MANTEAVPEDYKPDDKGWAQRWKAEYDASRKSLEKWHQQAEKVVKAYLDERGDLEAGLTKWNLFHSNVETLASMLYGNTPKASVSRRFADSEDDVARIAGEIAERLLHTDLERRGDTAEEAFGNALSDRLLGGCGTVRVRYTAEEEEVPGEDAQLHPETGQELAPAVPATTQPSAEEAPIDYVYWRDFLWSAGARVWSEVQWVGFAADMTKESFVARFGDDGKGAVSAKGDGTALWRLVPKQSKAHTEDEREKDPWARVRVWEFWHKGEEKVFFWAEGFDRTLDIVDDPLSLDGFFPCPRPLLANLTTTKLVPRPDYVLAQDLYLEIDSVSTRIERLQRAIKAIGVYDASNSELKSLLDVNLQNTLLPAENWGGFLEKGGLQGAIQFLPLDTFVNALTALRDYRKELVDALYQVTGQADIMRGQQTTAGEAATTSAAKVRFGSVRVQRLQDEFARFVSDAQALKLEVIAKHFQPQAILEKSNAAMAFKTEEASQPGIVNAAVQLLQSEAECYRVEVKPESVSLTDFSQLQSERTQVLDAIAGFMQRVGPVVQMAGPQSMPFLLKLLQAAIAGLKGSSTMEGIIDAAIVQMERAQQEEAQNPQAKQENPQLAAERMKQQTAMVKGQADLQKEQFKLQADLTRTQAETQATGQREAIQRQENVREAAERQLVANSLKPQAPPRGLP